MKKILSFIKGAIFNPALFIIIMISLNSWAADQDPEVSIVTDKAPGLPVVHGLNRLTDALGSKNIPFEKVASVNEAREKWLILTGLASGEGAAARMLKDGSHTVPKVSEPWTIWKQIGRKNRFG